MQSALQLDSDAKGEEFGWMKYRGAHVSQYQISEGMMRSERVLPLLEGPRLFVNCVDLLRESALQCSEVFTQPGSSSSGCCGSPL